VGTFPGPGPFLQASDDQSLSHWHIHAETFISR
jgi:hypothetical protein